MDIIGRDGWDYVSMRDYAADMAELSGYAATITTNQRERIEELERMVWCLVKAAGGSIEIGNHVLDGYRRGLSELTISHVPSRDAMIVEASGLAGR